MIKQRICYLLQWREKQLSLLRWQIEINHAALTTFRSLHVLILFLDTSWKIIIDDLDVNPNSTLSSTQERYSRWIICIFTPASNEQSSNNPSTSRGKEVLVVSALLFIYFQEHCSQIYIYILSRAPHIFAERIINGLSHENILKKLNYLFLFSIAFQRSVIILCVCPWKSRDEL